MAEAHVAIAGTRAVLDAAGVLWLPDSRSLIVSDLHLEKASSFARRGMFLPPYDTSATLALLAQVMLRRNPARVISLGDSFHDGGGYDRLAELDRLRLQSLQRGREWIWVTGNHDRRLPLEIGGEVTAELQTEGLTLRHEPAPQMRQAEIAGHLHPAAKVSGRGRSMRCRAFATDGRRIVLPSFGVLTGGLNVLDRAFAPLFAAGSMRAFLIGAGRIFPVSASALSPD